MILNGSVSLIWFKFKFHRHRTDSLSSTSYAARIRWSNDVTDTK